MKTRTFGFVRFDTMPSAKAARAVVRGAAAGPARRRRSSSLSPSQTRKAAPA